MILFLIISMLILLVIGYNYFEFRKFKKKISNWEINDLIILNDKVDTDGLLLHEEMAILKGWDLDSVYLKTNSGVSKFPIKVVKFNKSDIWRINFEKSQIVMGHDPEFKYDLKFQEKKSELEKTVKSDENLKNPIVEVFSFNFDGKDYEISELSLHQATYYLKEAINHESYLIAHGIKEHINKLKDKK